MNQKEKAYALKRAQEIYIALKKDADKLIVKVDPVDVDPHTKLKLLKKGVFKIVPIPSVEKNGIGALTYVRDVLIFHREVRASTNTGKRDERIEQLRVKFGKVCDEIMLGDSRTALRLLREFEKETI